MWKFVHVGVCAEYIKVRPRWERCLSESPFRGSVYTHQSSPQYPFPLPLGHQQRQKHRYGAPPVSKFYSPRCEDLLVWRDRALGPGEVKPVAAIEYAPPVGSMSIGGRELVSEWLDTGGLSKRHCLDAGYQPCSDECLATLWMILAWNKDLRVRDQKLTPQKTADVVQLYHNAVLATFTVYQVRMASVVALQVSVPADTPATPSAAASRPEEAVARTDATVSKATSVARTAARQTEDNAARTGESAVLGISASSVNGLGNTTAVSCTSYVESGSTIALTPSTPVTTQAPEFSTPVGNGVYVYYYWTFTWSYWPYYFTYVDAAAETSLTTTYVTTTTVISAYETDSADATSELSRLSSSYFSTGFPTPIDATTALAQSTGGNTPSETESRGDNSDNGPGVSIGLGSVGGGGQAGGARMVQSSLPALSLWVFAMGAVVVGTGMLLL